MADKLAEVKPKLRGWIHLATVPLALAAFIVLIVLSPTRPPGSARPSSRLARS